MPQQGSHPEANGPELPEQRPWLLALVCAVLGVVAFAPALGGEWILDDGPLIASNRYVHGFEWWTRWFTHDLWDVDHRSAQTLDRVSYWRPLVSASYAFDWVVGRGSPVSFHATNLVWHALVAWLCFYTLRRWCGSSLGALAGTLLFALHPTKSESVAWISGRTDVLVTVAVLLASAGIALRLRGRRWGVSVEAAGTAVAYLVKEQAVVLPLVAVVEGWVAAGRPPLTRAVLNYRGPVALAALPQLVVACSYLLLRAAMLPLRQFEVSGLGLFTHVGFVLETVGRYVELAAWPADLSMQRAVIRSTADGPVVAYGYVALGAVVLAGAVWAAAGWRRSQPHLTVGLGFMFLTLLPVSNLMWGGRLALISPRFCYLPLLGPVLALAVLLARTRRRRATLAVVGLVASALCARSLVRARDFTSRDRFWNYELRQNPDAPLPLQYAITRDLREGRPRTALQRAACAHSAALRSFSHTGDAGKFVLLASEILAGLTPDQRRHQLRAIQRFVRAVLEEQPDPACLETAEFRVVLPQAGKAARKLRRMAPRMLLLMARLDSRLDNDARALAAAERAVAGCSRCPLIVSEAALLAARAGVFEQAERWQSMAERMRGASWGREQRERIQTARVLATRAAQVPERTAARLDAQRHAMLGAWGRAYWRLRPYRAEIERAGAQPVAQYAELAYRAGDGETARRLLGRHSPERQKELLAKWARNMRWDDPGSAPSSSSRPQHGCYW